MTDFSYQLYSSRNFPPMADTFAMLKNTGYTQVEGYGAMFANAAQIAETEALLARSGLTMPTAHIGLDTLENQPELVADAADRLGFKAVFAPFVMPEDRPTNGAGWRKFGERAEKAGALLRDRGIAFGWHNHDFEFLPIADGTYPIDALLEGGPSLRLELDLAWVARAGEDPVKWIGKFADRIIAVHVKDLAPNGECADEDSWADVGHGVIDWKAMRDALASTKTRFLVMEHDNPSDHERFARRSIASAQTIWG